MIRLPGGGRCIHAGPREELKGAPRMKRLSVSLFAFAAAAAFVACGPKNPPPADPVPAPSPAPTAPSSAAAWPKDYAALQPVEVAPLAFDLTPAQIAEQCAAAEKTTDDKLAKLVAIPDASRTFRDSFEGLEDATVDYVETVTRLSFLKD